MADLIANFRLVDEMSSKLGNIAESGQNMIKQWEESAECAETVFSDVTHTVARTATSVDGVAVSINNFQSAEEKLTAESEALESSLDNGEEALKSYESAMKKCEQSGNRLFDSIDRVEKNEKSISDAMEKAAKVSEKLSNSEKVSAETKDKLASACQKAERAMEALSEAHQRADEATKNFREVQSSGTESLEELAKAAEKANRAALELESADRAAADATNDLSKASQKALKEAKDGSDAVETLKNALAAAGIMKTIDDIANSLFNAADAAAQTETAFAKLQSIAGDEAMGVLTKQIKELSAETGIEQKVLADVAYNAISAGASVENAVGTAGASAKLAAAGFTETSSALSVLSTAMNSYGDSAGTATDISDSLIMVQNLGVTTVAELSASMGKSISTAAAYNVSLGNLESAYVSVTKAGINTAEATTYISGMLSELGKEGSTVAEILQDETGQSFGQLMNAGYTLADVLDIIYDSAGNDAEAMMNLWGSQTAGVASAAIINQGLEQFNDNLVAIEESAGATENAYSIMANTTEHSHERMINSAENLKIAIGDNLNPALEKLYNIGAVAFQWGADFAEEHPMVVKAVTAVAVGIGSIAVAVAGYTFVTKVAIPPIVAFGSALNGALGPIGWVALAITAVVAAGTALVAMMNDAEDETEGMTAVTREQYYQLKDLNAEYEEACTTYGETSEEALRLKYQVGDLSEAFENNRQTLDEFQTEVDELCTSVSDLWSEFDKNISAINANETGALALVQKYEDLTEKTSLTAGEQKQLEAVTRSLAEQFPDLTDKLDATTLSTKDYIEALKKSAQAEADIQRQQEAQSAYVEALKKQVELEEEIAKAEENLRLEKEAFNSVEWEWWSDQAFYQATGGWLGGWTNDIDEYQAALDKLKAAQEENNAEVAELERNFEALAKKEQEVAERQLTNAEAVNIAYGNVREKIEDLCTAYEEVYQAALESFEGQFGLFDEASTKSEEYMNSTVDNAQKALDSQLAYWDTYLSNINILKDTSARELGITQENYEALMTYVQDGSEQAAGLAASMAEAIQNGDKDAVSALANTIGNINLKQEELAETTADWVTDFSTEMSKIEREMQMTVRKLNLSDEAADSAAATINEYADKIREGKDGAIEAAKDVAEAVSIALLNSDASLNVNTTVRSIVPGHARGTTNAENVFVAGEEGPELIIGQQGSTVFPANETERIINAVDEMENVYNYPSFETEDYAEKLNGHSQGFFGGISQLFNSILQLGENNRLISALDNKQQLLQIFPEEGSHNEKNSEQKKHITIDISGSGAIEVSGGETNKETVLEVLCEHLKPVLMNIIQSEIYEEGDLSYDY